MEDIKKAVDAVLAHSCITIELMLDKALSGKKVRIRNAKHDIGLGGSWDTFVGKVENVIGCKTGNLSDGMLVTLLVEVDRGGASNNLLEVECFHRNIIVLDSE